MIWSVREHEDFSLASLVFACSSVRLFAGSHSNRVLTFDPTDRNSPRQKIRDARRFDDAMSIFSRKEPTKLSGWEGVRSRHNLHDILWMFQVGVQ
jgi:hypothetical protein